MKKLLLISSILVLTICVYFGGSTMSTAYAQIYNASTNSLMNELRGLIDDMQFANRIIKAAKADLEYYT